MRNRALPLLIGAMLCLGFGMLSVSAQVVKEHDPDLDRIDIVEHRGATIPLDLTVTNEDGVAVPLSSYFQKDRPVILMLGYYECPMLCNLVFNGMAEAVKTLPLVAGKDYQILSLSINPRETAELAKAKKRTYAAAVGKPEMQNGWQFLTADSATSARLANAIGFRYFYDTDQKQYAHAAAAYVLSPAGVICRYHYGIEFPERDLRWSLIEAAQGKIGEPLDKLLLYCYHYDPEARSYSPMAMRFMQLGGLVTVAFVGSTIVVLRRHEKRGHGTMPSVPDAKAEDVTHG